MKIKTNLEHLTILKVYGVEGSGMGHEHSELSEIYIGNSRAEVKAMFRKDRHIEGDLETWLNRSWTTLVWEDAIEQQKKKDEKALEQHWKRVYDYAKAHELPAPQAGDRVVLTTWAFGDAKYPPGSQGSAVEVINERRKRYDITIVHEDGCKSTYCGAEFHWIRLEDVAGIEEALK